MQSIALHSQGLVCPDVTLLKDCGSSPLPSFLLCQSIPRSHPSPSPSLLLLPYCPSALLQQPSFLSTTYHANCNLYPPMLCAWHFLPGAFKPCPVFPLPTISSAPLALHMKGIFSGQSSLIIHPRTAPFFISSYSHLPIFLVTSLLFASLYQEPPSLCVQVEDKTISPCPLL